jgi:hypothetical protein
MRILHYRGMQKTSITRFGFTVASSPLIARFVPRVWSRKRGTGDPSLSSWHKVTANGNVSLGIYSSAAVVGQT